MAIIHLRQNSVVFSWNPPKATPQFLWTLLSKHIWVSWMRRINVITILSTGWLLEGGGMWREGKHRMALMYHYIASLRACFFFSTDTAVMKGYGILWYDQCSSAIFERHTIFLQRFIARGISTVWRWTRQLQRECRDVNYRTLSYKVRFKVKVWLGYCVIYIMCHCVIIRVSMMIANEWPSPSSYLAPGQQS